MIPQPDYEFKMVLVGQSSVGKSSILNRFVDDQFHQSLLSTIGVDFKFRKIKVDGNDVKLQIWDTAGQETFRAIVSAYYNSADAIVIVYDITSDRSWEVLLTINESIKDYWLEEAQNQNKNNANVFLIGNKLDEATSKRQVQSFSVEGVMDSGKITRHFEVSAKDGTNIEQTFSEIVRVLIKKTNPNKAIVKTRQEDNVRIDKRNTQQQRGQQTKKSSCCLK